MRVSEALHWRSWQSWEELDVIVSWHCILLHFIRRAKGKATLSETGIHRFDTHELR